MPRLREIPRSEVTDDYVLGLYNMLFGDRDPVSEPGTATGTPGNWWTVFAQVPDAFKHTTEGFGFYRSSNRKLDSKLRELGQIRAGYAIGSQFVYSQHSKAMRFEGFSEEQVKAIPHWQVADCFSELERAVLAYTDGLVTEKGRIADGVFDCLKKHLSEVEILELTYVTCTYMMHAVLSRALQLECDDDPERVGEVEAPEGPTADVMGTVEKPKYADKLN